MSKMKPESEHEARLVETVRSAFPFRARASQRALLEHRLALRVLFADPRIAGREDVKQAIREHL